MLTLAAVVRETNPPRSPHRLKLYLRQSPLGISGENGYFCNAAKNMSSNLSIPYLIKIA